MKSKAALVTLFGLVIVGGGLAMAFRPKEAHAAEPEDDLGPENQDLAAGVDASGGTQIVVADDVTEQVVVMPPQSESMPPPPLPTDNEVEDVQAAKRLADAVELEPEVPLKEAVEEVLPEVDETAEIAAEVAAEPPRPAPPVVQAPPVQAPPIVQAPPVGPPVAPPVLMPKPGPAPAPQAPAPVPPPPVVVSTIPLPQTPEEAAEKGPMLYQAYLLRAEREKNWEELGQELTKTFQEAYDLTPDGMAGPGTILKLVSLTKTNPVPIVRKWPKNTWVGSKAYNDYIKAIRDLGLDPSREKGQGLTNAPITDLRTL